jgi:hypothetical protein
MPKLDYTLARGEDFHRRGGALHYFSACHAQSAIVALASGLSDSSGLRQRCNRASRLATRKKQLARLAWRAASLQELKALCCFFEP